MRQLLLTFFAITFISLTIQAQEEITPAPCGTLPGKSAWLKKYQQNPAAHQRNTDTLLYIPISVHLTSNDAGNTYFKINRLIDAFCKLNADFEEANLYFYLEGTIDSIPFTPWFSHETVLEGAEMMFANNIEHTVNTYFVGNAAGNCGYNLPYAGIAMDHSCSNPNDDTWAHEMGHNLSLPHPFLGWEGGQTINGEMPADFSNPAPTHVTYDYTYFQDTLIMDTLIIDTALVELVDGSNCYLASDGFCDTAPDYIANRWFCNGQGVSAQIQLDPNGEPFQSDGSLIMCYADDDCQGRFSPEQIAAMRANVYEEKPDLLYNQTPAPEVSSTPATLNAPIGGDFVQFDAPFFEWEAVENATHYIVNVSLLPTFGALNQEYITTEPFFELPEDLLNERTYYWRVRAYNSHSFCTLFSETATFETAQLSDINTITSVNKVRVFPNPALGGQAITIELESRKGMNASLNLRNYAGQLIQSDLVNIQPGYNRLQVSQNNLAKGFYLIELDTNEGKLVEKLIIE